MITYHEVPQTSPHPGALPSWHEDALAAYRYRERERLLALRMELVTRVQALTGHQVAPDAVYVNREAGTATVAVDGSIFRLARRQLTLLRPCAYCGTGQFASRAIESLADLDFALVGWVPLHDDCQPADASDTIESLADLDFALVGWEPLHDDCQPADADDIP